MFKVLNDLVILPSYVDDALKSNYLGLALGKNANALRDILSPRDLSFYILMNEPNYLFNLLRSKLQSTTNDTTSKSLALLDTLEESFTMKGIVTSDPEVLQHVENLRLELLGSSIDDIFGFLGSVKIDDVPFISVKFCGIDTEQFAICPYLSASEDVIHDDVGVIIKNLLSLYPVEAIAKLPLFTLWEVGIHRTV